MRVFVDKKRNSRQEFFLSMKFLPFLPPKVTGSMKSCGWHPSFKIKTIEAFRRPSVCERAFFHQETSPPEDNLSTDNLRVSFESETMHVRG